MTLGRDWNFTISIAKINHLLGFLFVALTARKNGQKTTHRSRPEHSASTYLRAT
ncbi:hypothetical protein CDV58_09424, partial [Aspergillus fumigatus]